MHHPFDLNIYELENIGLYFEELSHDQSEKVSGGYNVFAIEPVVVFGLLGIGEGSDEGNQDSGSTTTRKNYTSPDGRTKSTEVVTNSWRSNLVTS
ncbi:MAG: hypothetical protein KME28_12355 [Pelatocladus maniniholoensis HA4357-MV3]|jgi:hypothetical protein|uniref:Uncharacterized protein n=1 Tax=Pelatocladus maniniholoensis HA4357-MV3 TaxID=1117104 RepID=A0A9E3LTE1_9NOST|nr:hypothetical protein [Pelatocladus maniniholoensis HA4357-MV3]BAZ67221.1 hypothetical protein NIES4106_19750 [Fischerella sp. NIES-4106]